MPIAAGPVTPGEDEPSLSVRHSMYQFVGSKLSHGWPRIVECFFPAFVCGSVKWASLTIESHVQIYDNQEVAADVLQHASTPNSFFHQEVSDWSARSVSALVSLAFFVLALATLCTVGYVIHEALEQVRKRYALGGAIAVLTVAAFWRLCKLGTGASAMMGALMSAHASPGQQQLYTAIYATGNAIVVLVACGMCTLLVPDFRANAGRVVSDHDILFLARRMRWTRAILYTLAPLLVFSALENYVATSSIAVYLVGVENQKLMLLMANRSTLMFGGLYSILLVCTYAPTEAILRVRAMGLASDAHVKPTERAKWLEERGLKLSAVDQLKTVLALLSPVLASLVGQIGQGALRSL
jgi:hypothetical protein